MDQPDKFVNPARGQPNGENEYFPVRGKLAPENLVGLARRVRQFLHASSCSSSYCVRGVVHFFLSCTACGPCNTVG